jgi:hypothetical protein
MNLSEYKDYLAEAIAVEATFTSGETPAERFNACVASIG